MGKVVPVGQLVWQGLFSPESPDTTMGKQPRMTKQKSMGKQTSMFKQKSITKQKSRNTKPTFSSQKPDGDLAKGGDWSLQKGLIRQPYRRIGTLRSLGTLARTGIGVPGGASNLVSMNGAPPLTVV